jgi:uncharacterized protein YjiS (DUF1127 family)
MFLWQLCSENCITLKRLIKHCINTIEKAMTQISAYALSTHPLPPFSRVLLRLTLVAVTWEMRRRTRQNLRNLDDHMLSDIGLDPATASAEAAKPFWRA